MSAARCSADLRRGFTLIELLVVVTIIGILASVSLATMYVSTERAKEAHTRAIITRLDAVVMARYESYRTRRLPMDPRTLVSDASDAREVARVRLQGIRDMMRMEMPDSWADVTNDPVFKPYFPRPALNQAYFRRYENNVDETGTQLKPTPQYQNAECLFLVVTMGALEEDSSALDTFRHEDVGDADGDGVPEFHDGWGQPIRFQRWVPGFVSVLQPDANPATTDDPETPEIEGLERDAVNNHDPFDPLRLDMPPPAETATLLRTEPSAFAGFRLYPLIYSAGADGQVDLLDTYADLTTEKPSNDPYFDPAPSTTTAEKWLGAPYDHDSDGLNHLDNIHNHQLGELTR
jgi:prepilin-type N-terminal cleavage/methylation domain-containing protein